jgi:hypothetical protein
LLRYQVDSKILMEHYPIDSLFLFLLTYIIFFLVPAVRWQFFKSAHESVVWFSAVVHRLPPAMPVDRAL